VPVPIASPIVAMQKEVLRDLPVVAIPEPLPWTRPAPPRPVEPEPVAATSPPAPPPAFPNPRVQVQPTATVAFAPATVAEEPVSPWPPEPVSPWPAELASPWPTAPVAEPQPRPTARRSPRAHGRPLLLLGVAAALVVGAHVALTRMPSVAADASEQAGPAAAAEEMVPAGSSAVSPPEPAAAATTPPAPATRVSSAPARLRMTPGPAFSGSAPLAPGGPPGPSKPPAAASNRAQPIVDSAAPAIAPAPVAPELSLPDLSTDSIVPAARAGDSMAMKKILRALNGPKP
jgi:hypothetical protein